MLDIPALPRSQLTDIRAEEYERTRYNSVHASKLMRRSIRIIQGAFVEKVDRGLLVIQDNKILSHDGDRRDRAI